MQRAFPVLALLALTGCGAGGFTVRFTTAEYQGQAWSLKADEPTPQRGTGGTRGWQVQAADGPRVSWFYTQSVNDWPPERALLLVALEDAPGAVGDSWQAAWDKPGVVARTALAQVADVRWMGEPVREVGDEVELERAPVVLRSGSAWGASLSGGFFIRGHVVCRREARASLIACAVAGYASDDEPTVTAADFAVDAELASNAEWLTGYVKSLRLSRR